MKAYFRDSAMPNPATGAGFVEHDELELTDDELARIKARARKALTMDAPEPVAYRRFLDGGERVDGFNKFLKGEH